MPISVRVEYIEEVSSGNFRWVPKELVFNVEDAFTIDENNVDAEVCRMGQLLLEYGSVQADLQTQAARKKSDVDYVFSVEAQKLRAGTEKLTESAIKEKVALCDTYRMALMAYQDAEGEATRFTNFFKSLQKKADLIIALAYKQRAEIKNF